MGPGAGRLRGAAIAAAVIVLAIAGSWLLPGLAWRGVSAMQRPQAVQDTTPPAARPAPPTVPGMQIPAPEAGGPREAGSPWSRLTGLLGLALIVAIGVALSHNRRAIRWRVVAWGLALQVLFAIFVLRVPAGQALFRWLGSLVTAILGYSYVGSQFVFGELGKPNSSLGIIFAFQLLPAIIFVSALFAILYFLGVMQLVVRAFAVIMSRVMGASGAESLNVAASIFMGQTEAPLTIRPFLPRMTRSELMTVMTSGMAHISGSIMVAYIAFGIEARHLLTAVIMTAPGTIMMAKLFEPETDVAETYGTVKLDMPRQDVNLLDAAARGTGEGLSLMLNVIAMLVSFVALVALLNGGFEAVHRWADWFPPNLQTVLGWIFRPIAWAMGVPWHDSGTVGSLLGTRMVLNEFIAYAQLGPLKGQLDPRSFTIASFALAGFANFSSIGIQLGGIGALAPERKRDLARLGFRAMLAGTLANFLSATIAGILL
jgi:CNT family concentrative nucleoside transporter